MTEIFGKKIPQIPPKRCEICEDYIGLFEPYYTVVAKEHGIKLPKNKETALMCLSCYQMYKDFLVTKKTEIRHKQIKENLKNEHE